MLIDMRISSEGIIKIGRNVFLVITLLSLLSQEIKTIIEHNDKCLQHGPRKKKEEDNVRTSLYH